LLFQGRKELVGKLLFKFRDTYADLIPTLNGMLEAEEYNQARFLVHGLSGAAEDLGAREIFHCSGVIEKFIKEGRLDEVPGQVPGLEAALALAFKAINKLNSKDR
jgi:HPt (histidine-containing phosphotransfer) domain-containing protein